MSEGIIVAFISFVGAILGALIIGFATLASGERGNRESGRPVSCGTLGFFSSIGATLGLILGALFASYIVEPYDFSIFTSQPSETTDVSPAISESLSPESNEVIIVVTATSENNPTDNQTEDEQPIVASNPTTNNVPSEPTLIETITVIANDNQGTPFTAPQDGNYTFDYNNGAYCVYPNPASAPEPSCLTAVWIFADGANFWQADGRSLNHNTRLAFIAGFSNCDSGRSGYCNTTSEAEQIASGMPNVSVNLSAGDTLHFITVDHFEAYWDNPGEVDIDVFRN